MPNSPIDETLLRTIYAYDADLPLDPEVTPLESAPDLAIEHFTITSRHGQRVPGLFLRNPRADGPRPTLVIGHPGRTHKASSYVLAPARAWVARGVQCVTMDQPNHGERKALEQSPDEAWRYPFRRMDEAIQAATDWRRVLDYLLTRPEVDGTRIGYVGFSMGGHRGVSFVGLDARVRAAVFCIAGAGRHEATDDRERIAVDLTDPATFGPLTNGRPTLIVAGSNDDVVLPEQAQALYDSLAEPKQIDWVPTGHWDFMPAGMGSVWPFLAGHVLSG